MADESYIHPNVPPMVLFTTSFHQIPPPLQNTQKSPSIAGSTTSDRGLRDSIRNGDNVDEDLIQSYVTRLFTGYLDNKVRDYSLWQSLLYDFEDFTEYHWTFLESQQWDLVQKVCYTQGIWLNHPGKRGSRAQIMPTMLQGDYYDNWTIKEMYWVEGQYNKLSPAVQLRKDELLALSTSNQGPAPLGSQVENQRIFSTSPRNPPPLSHDGLLQQAPRRLIRFPSDPPAQNPLIDIQTSQDVRNQRQPYQPRQQQ